MHDHVTRLRTSGLSLRKVCAEAGVDRAAYWRNRTQGLRMQRAVATRLLAVTARPVTKAERDAAFVEDLTFLLDVGETPAGIPSRLGYLDHDSIRTRLRRLGESALRDRYQAFIDAHKRGAA